MSYPWKKDKWKAVEQLERLFYNYPDVFLQELQAACYQEIEIPDNRGHFDRQIRLGTENFGIQSWTNKYHQTSLQVIYKSNRAWSQRLHEYVVLARLARTFNPVDTLKSGQGLYSRLDYYGPLPPFIDDDIQAYLASEKIQELTINFLVTNGWVEEKKDDLLKCSLLVSPLKSCLSCPRVVVCALKNSRG